MATGSYVEPEWTKAKEILEGTPDDDTVLACLKRDLPFHIFGSEKQKRVEQRGVFLPLLHHGQHVGAFSTGCVDKHLDWTYHKFEVLKPTFGLLAACMAEGCEAYFEEYPFNPDNMLEPKDVF